MGGAPDGRYKRSTNFVKNVQNGSKVWLPLNDAWSNKEKLEAILAGLARAQVKGVPQPLTREFLTATKGKGFQVPNTALQHALGQAVKKDGGAKLGRTDAISRIMEVQEGVSKQHGPKRRRRKA